MDDHKSISDVHLKQLKIYVCSLDSYSIIYLCVV